MSTYGIQGDRIRFYSKAAPNVTLVTYKNGREDRQKMERNGDVWEANITPCDYAFEVEGALYPDPYAKDLNTPSEWGGDRGTLFSRFSLPQPFDWRGHKNHTLSTELIYEMHVRGFTQDPSSKIQNPGTFLGVIEKIDHLKVLGVSAVELLPVFEFDERPNYWGYSPISLFTPMRRYGTTQDFQTMVRELHKNGIGVILDVVYNHLGNFPLCNKETYFLLDSENNHTNFSGCGNTLNCNNPITAQWILDSLTYWIEEMGVDGFRFDLASILTRMPDFTPTMDAPLIQSISKLNTTLIAEPWDAAGLYQLGQFPPSWLEWNGAMRDHLRQRIPFKNPLPPEKSVNFITAHDGFTLNDLVSYNQKHNEANGEENRDGSDDNHSDNCGVEGSTDNPTILAKRQERIEHLLTSLSNEAGSKMIVMGDEYGHTRLGNNNPWCQDNRLNYFCWDLLEKNHTYFKMYCRKIGGGT